MEDIVLHTFAFLKEGTNIEEPEIGPLNKGEAEGNRDGSYILHGGQFCSIIGKGRTQSGMSLPFRLHEAGLESA